MLILSFILYASLVLAAPLRVRYSQISVEPARRTTARRTVSRNSCRGLSSAKGPATITSSLTKSIFPQTTKAQWSTAPGVASETKKLSDATLNPTHKSSTPYTYENAPDGKLSLKATYPKGSYKPAAEPAGGFSFYAHGPSEVDLTKAKEAVFAYSVMFPEGFVWVKGGKLPGFYGGDSEEESISCSGGRRDTACFSSRMMWRSEGKGELYTYLPPGLSGNTNFCNDPASDCNPTYGASIGRGSFQFTPGEWTTMSQRLKLNDPDEANGEIEISIGGVSTINVRGVTIRHNEEGRIRGLQMQTFFGGSTTEWATPKEQNVYFSDISVGITEYL